MDSEFDAVWHDIYAQGRVQYAPWDSVVTFLFRNAPKDVPRHEVRILEVGCGTASNLFFAAQQGFSVAGIDGSPKAIEFARKRFEGAGLRADLHVGDFTADLPFTDAVFDLAIDRGAITCASFHGAKQCIAEVGRVLKLNGRFFFNPYSDRSSSAASGCNAEGRQGPGGLRENITEGTLTGVGQVCFYGLADIFSVMDMAEWRLLQMQHSEYFDCLQPKREMHAEYRVVAEKTR